MFDDMTMDHPIPRIIRDESNFDPFLREHKYRVGPVLRTFQLGGGQNFERVSVHVHWMHVWRRIRELKTNGRSPGKGHERWRQMLVAGLRPGHAVNRPKGTRRGTKRIQDIDLMSVRKD